MEHELQDIKKIRKKLSLTQTELAKKAGVSQSLIAKIEANVLDPGYSKTKQIFDALENLAQDEETTAQEIMQKKVVTASADEKIPDIIKNMKKYAISQIPIIDKNSPVGLMTESVLLDKISSGADITKLRARDIMEECPPVVTPTTKISVIAHLLRHFPIVLVAEKGALKGLVSKADLIENIGRTQ